MKKKEIFNLILILMLVFAFVFLFLAMALHAVEGDESVSAIVLSIVSALFGLAEIAVLIIHSKIREKGNKDEE